jgi:type II secretory ATPase GspE/PulE/Tfp pilus assembly ATPase PilB-like protein
VAESTPTTADEVPIMELLVIVLDRGASDLHVTSGTEPTIRLNGQLQRLDQYPRLLPDQLQRMVYSILTQKQRERLENDLDLDFSYSVPGVARFRANLFIQRGAYGAVFRIIPFEIKSVDDLGLPQQVKQFAIKPRGLILVTGPTGSGKSTSLAALIDIIETFPPTKFSDLCEGCGGFGDVIVPTKTPGITAPITDGATSVSGTLAERPCSSKSGRCWRTTSGISKRPL